MTELLTSSRLRAFNDCKRLEWWLYKEGVRPARDEEALRVGTLVHLGLEAWLLAQRSTEDRDEWLQLAVAAVWGRAFDAYEQVRVEEMLRGYHERYSHEVLDVVAAEFQFEGPLLNPDSQGRSRTFNIAGKIDGLVRVDGRILILEHKTTSEDISDPSAGYFEKLSMDSQVSMYYLGAIALGYDVEGCLYDVIRKPALRPYQATPEDKRKYKRDGTLYANQREHDETPEEYRNRVREAIAAEPDRYYRRHEVHRLDAQLQEFMYDAWGAGLAMRQVHQAAASKGLQVVPRNPSACHRFGRCFLWPVCSAGMDPDEHPDRYRRVENVHPELEEKQEVEP